MYKKYSLLIFDWDGTLANSKPLTVAATQKAAVDLGLPAPTEEMIDRYFGIELTEMLARLLPGGNLEKLTQRFYHHFSYEPLFDKTLATLTQLKNAGFTLALATNRTRIRLEQALTSSGTRLLFTATRTVDECARKPHPAMVLEILEELRHQPAAALMIGDSEADMQAAKNAGIAGMAACYDAQSRKQMKILKPTYYLNAIEELPEKLWQKSNQPKLRQPLYI